MNIWEQLSTYSLEFTHLFDPGKLVLISKGRIFEPYDANIKKKKKTAIYYTHFLLYYKI